MINFQRALLIFLTAMSLTIPASSKANTVVTVYDIDIGTAVNCTMYADIILDGVEADIELRKVGRRLENEYLSDLQIMVAFYERVCIQALPSPGTLYAVCDTIPSNPWCNARKKYWINFSPSPDRMGG